MRRYRCASMLSFFTCCLIACAAFAQDRTAAKSYGEGVHAFHAGEYQQAVELFTRSISEDSSDPRSYYYRGASHWKLNDRSQATVDFESGAQQETNGPALPYKMSKVLERVQGPARLSIEAARKTAVKNRKAAVAAWKQARFEQMIRAEKLTLYPINPIPGSKSLTDSMQIGDSSNDPFSTGKLFAVGKRAPDSEQAKLILNPATQPIDPATSPTAPGGSKPAGADPFGTKKDSDKPADSKKTDPFGDPFGN